MGRRARRPGDHDCPRSRSGVGHRSRTLIAAWSRDGRAAFLLVVWPGGPGGGVVTVAPVSLALGAGPLAAAPGRRVAATAALAGLAAFLVDVCLY